MNTKQEKAEMIKLIDNVKPFYVETIAEALYDAGYRKVLFDTENGKAVDVAQYAPWKLVDGYTEREVEKARKETAKEILLLLGKGYNETEKTEFNNLQWYKEFCRELKHRYGVEVEE